MPAGRMAILAILNSVASLSFIAFVVLGILNLISIIAISSTIIWTLLIVSVTALVISYIMWYSLIRSIEKGSL